VYYAVDVDYSKGMHPAYPSLALAVKEKFPNVDTTSFLGAFK
jgi:hypothetical protein